ncbi:MAG TPA: polysaccharide biosynthesis tyrosine autokinase [Candidatus Limnocylindria bacterium]|nr:polysaccharide biosynthesis tyrosine autokinase [Candidatus Limnocylindria bacterium]
MNDTLRERESKQIHSTLGRIFLRRKTILALCLLGALGPVIYYNQTTVPVYESSTSLVFEEFGSSVVKDVYSAPSSEMLLFNRIEEIKSRAFAEEIAATLPDRLKARFPKPAQPGMDVTQHVADIVNKGMTAAPLRNSNIVRIRVRLNDPELCAAVANLSLDVLRSRNYRVRTEGAADLRKFIEEQLARFRDQLQLSERNLQSFKERNSITSLDNESMEVLKRMTDAEVLLNTTRADRGASQQKRAAVETTLTGQRSELVSAMTNIASPSAQRLKERLVSLQEQYAQLDVQGYPAEHPQRIRLQQELEQTRTALAEEAQKVAQGSHIGDPFAQIERRVDQSISLEIDIKSMEARETALKKTLGEYRGFLARLPAQEVQLARLVLDRDVNAKIYTSLLERREEVRISEAKHIPNTRVIDRAHTPKNPAKPRKTMNLMLGTLVGLIAGTGLGFLLENRAGKLGSMQDFERETGWTVLALVPELERTAPWRRWMRRIAEERLGAKSNRSATLVSHRDPESAAGEAFFMLRTRLELLGLGTKYRSILITSSWPRDGKSTTISNLAATFGAAGRAALVVDAELRRPTMHTIFGAHKAPGLSDLLLARNGDGGKHEATPTAAEASGDNGMFQSTQVEGITLLASGKRIREPQWEAARVKMRELLVELEEQYDVILVDSASPILVHDTLALCGMVDAVVVIVDAQSYDEDRLMETKRLLESAGANIVGAVLNRVDPGGRYSYYYHHYY